MEFKRNTSSDNSSIKIAKMLSEKDPLPQSQKKNPVRDKANLRISKISQGTMVDSLYSYL